MAFDIETKANIAFKKIAAKAHTSNNRDPVNEPYVTRPLITTRDIWAQAIAPDTSVATAVSEGIVGDATRVTLELEPISGTNDVSGSSFYTSYRLIVPASVPAGLDGKINPRTGVAYAPGDHVSNIILEAFSNSNFRLHLYTDSSKTEEIPPLDASDWIIDPVAGVLTQEDDEPGHMRDLSNSVLECYVYVGQFSSDATSEAGSTTLDGAYQNESGTRLINVDDGGIDWQLDGHTFVVSDGTDPSLTISENEVGVDVDLRVKGIKSDNVTTAIPFDQATVTALHAEFTATSIIGAINENKQDYETLVDDLASQTDPSGATLIGVEGITGIIPTGGSVGDAADLQAMLEGIAMGAGGLKSYADEAAFIAAKEAGDEYLPVNTLVLIRDTNRFAMVLVEGTNAAENTDWDYLWGSARALDGAEFNVTSTDTTINSSGAVSVTGDSIALSASGAELDLTTDGAVSLSSYDGQEIDITSDTAVNIDGGALVAVEATAVTVDGATTITAPLDTAITLNTTGTGDIFLNSEDTINMQSPASFFTGNVTVDSGSHLTVDQIFISSVDPSDLATITGQRTGIIDPNNLLQNSGFEEGTGGNADNWTEGTHAGRNQLEKYYDNWSIQYQGGSLESMENWLTQATTGLNTVAHTFSLYFKGHSDSGVEVLINGGTAVEVIPPATTLTDWTRFDVEVTPGAADGDFILRSDVGILDANNFFIDAVMLEEGTTLNPYFSTQKSELIMRIGHDPEDKISFQSMSPEGGTIEELMAINNDSVRVYGDLIVDGTTTTINSTELTIEDNKITLNSNMEGDPKTEMPDGKAGIEVNRGTEVPARLRWNESDEKWELGFGGGTVENPTTFAIMTSTTGDTTLSMQTAYNGGSGVTVDDTNVDFLLDAGKSFIISSSASPNKFNVTAGSGTDSIRMNTTGGIDIDAQGGITIDEDSGAKLHLTAAGQVTLESADGQSATLSSDTLVAIAGGDDITLTADDVAVTGDFGVTGDSTLTGALTQTGGAFSLTGNAASNITAAEANVTVATTTSGDVVLNSAGEITFNDERLASAMPLSEEDNGGLSSNFEYDSQVAFDWTVRGTEFNPTSVLGAINATRDDLYEYVELLNTQGAAIGVAAGANLVGVDGITGVVPVHSFPYTTLFRDRKSVV